MSTSQPTHQEQQQSKEDIPTSRMSTTIKCLLSTVLLISAFFYSSVDHHQQELAMDAIDHFPHEETSESSQHYHRRLSMIVGDTIPQYMENLMKDLRERKKLFQETPPEEVKYWFEYTGPLQVRRKNKPKVMYLFMLLFVHCLIYSKAISFIFKNLIINVFPPTRNTFIASANHAARRITLKDVMIQVLLRNDLRNPFWGRQSTPNSLDRP
jgi:hypothetical protein